jgi:serine/threonine protein kinase
MPSKKTTIKAASHGGKYIGRGTFGCTFRPAVRCKTHKNRNKNAIAKIMSPGEANSEYKLTQHLQAIDPEQLYTLYPYKICEPELNAINLENSQGKCRNILNTPVKKAIFLKDGGENLEMLLAKAPKGPFNKLHRSVFRALQNLFIGLEHLHAQDFVHLDIKVANIVCKLVEGSEWRYFGLYIGKPTYVMKYIDFGLSNKTENALDRFEEFDYLIWPFDLRLAKPNYLSGKNDLQPIDIRFYYNIIRDLPRQHKQFLPYWILHHTAKTPDLDFYTAQHAEIKAMGPEGKKEARAAILKKTDVYSLGLVLSHAYGALTGIVKLDETTYTIDKDAKLHSTITVPLFNLIDKMTHPDYHLRLNAREARIEYQTLLQAIESYFKK